MDLKDHPKLDPKLKETYDRIMGMKTGTKPTTPPATEHVEEVTIDTKPAADAPSTAPHASGHLSHIAYNASSGTTKPDEKKHEAVKHEEKKPEHKEVNGNDSMVVPIVLGVSGVIFFVFYAIFWIRFFGM